MKPEAFGLPGLPRQAWLEIDLAVLSGNTRALRSMLVPGQRLGIVVKADGYGHGLVAFAHAALLGGADLQGVATLDEGVALRSAGLLTSILVLCPVPSLRLAEAAGHHLDVVVIDQHGADEVAGFAGRPSTVQQEPHLRVHLGIETGMNRGGLRADRVVEAARLLLSSGAELAGTWSHLADAEDAATVDAQVARFDAGLQALQQAGIDLGARHLAASGGFLSERCPAYDVARVGLAFFGVMPWGSELTRGTRDVMGLLRPALALKAAAVSVSEAAAGERVGYGGEWEAARPSLIALLPLETGGPAPTGPVAPRWFAEPGCRSWGGSAAMRLRLT